jgi:WD40 repeat protein
MDDLRHRLDRLSPEARSYVYAELCQHLIKARQLDRLELLLTSLEFLAARTALEGLDGAVRDYDAARTAQGSEWDEDGGQAQFARFLSQRSHLLRPEPALIFQEAFNSIEVEVQRSAATLRQLGRFPVGPWLRKLAGAVEYHHSGWVISIAFWGDDRSLAVSTTAREVWVWDRISGHVRRRCDTPPSAAKSLAVSPSGDHLAAGYGSDLPTPMLAGVRVWSRDGGVVRTQVLRDWAYTVRWRSDTKIIAGAGLPSGSEAVGSLWQIDIAAATCVELGNWLADRPLVLTWEAVSGNFEQVMALSQDGFVLHLRPEYVPISRQEAQELSLQLMSDGDYAAHDARMEERRPILYRICAPTTDQFGFLCAADTIGTTNRICLLGEPPVPPEMLMLHESNPDGIYILDLSDGQLTRIGFNEDARASGFKATCIAASPVRDLLAIGTAHGAAYLFPVSTMEHVTPHRLHEGRAPVTALRFSDSGALLAVGDAASEIAVYELSNGERVFHTERHMPAVAGQVDNDRELVLFVDRLEVSLSSSSRPKETITWDDDLRAIDVAGLGDLAVILCLQKNEEPEAHDGQILQVIDLRVPRVLVAAPVPSILAGSARGNLGIHAEHTFRRVALGVDDGGCHVYLGSVDGVVEFPFLVHNRYRTFVLSEEATKRDRQMSVMRMGLEEPGLACGTFTAPTHDGALFCGYADNMAFPNVSGELHRWDVQTLDHSVIMNFASAITAIETTTGGLVVLGTEQGEVATLRYDGKWSRLVTLQHPVAISCVACNEGLQLACSISRDGLILLWDLLDGTRRLTASLDIEPVHVAFTSEGTQLAVVDRVGQLHVWSLENRSKLGRRDTRKKGASATTTKDETGAVEACLRTAEQLRRAVEAVAHEDSTTGMTLLRQLPNIPNRAELQRYWGTVLNPLPRGAIGHRRPEAHFD